MFGWFAISTYQSLERLELEQIKLDEDNSRYYLNVLMSNNISFQNKVTSLGGHQSLYWEGWSRYELVGSETDITIKEKR